MSDDIRINQVRLVQIMSGEVEPQTAAEELFKRAYISGIEGELLSTEIDNSADGLWYANAEEILHFVIGYAHGQKCIEENDEEFFVGSNDKKTVH